MNKAVYFLLSLFIGSLMVSCGGNQKPSERANVWDYTETEEVELSTEKVCAIQTYHR